MKPGVLIVGAGGFGRAVADAIGAAFSIAGFVDDRGPELGTVLGHPVRGRVADLAALRDAHAHAQVVVAIGDNARRREICMAARDAGFELLTIVHPRAIVSAHAQLGAGALVMAGAVVGTEAQVGEGAIVNAGAVIDHHASVGAFAHLGVGACMGGGAVLGALGWLRAGEVLDAGQRRDDVRQGRILR